MATKKKAKVVSGDTRDLVEGELGISVPPTVLWELVRDELGKRPSALRIAAEETTAGAVGFTRMTKFMKESYLGGLEASLKWQEENERATQNIIKGGFTGFQHWLGLYKNWTDKSLDQIQRQQSANLLLALSRQLIRASQAMAEPIFKAGVEVYEITADSYETLLAGPSRRYVLATNKTMTETIIPM